MGKILVKSITTEQCCKTRKDDLRYQKWKYFLKRRAQVVVGRAEPSRPCTRWGSGFGVLGVSGASSGRPGVSLTLLLWISPITLRIPAPAQPHICLCRGAAWVEPWSWVLSRWWGHHQGRDCFELNPPHGMSLSRDVQSLRVGAVSTHPGNS